MALSNFSKAKIYALFNNTSTGSAPTTYLAFFNASNTEVLPYATRPQVDFTYDTASSELRNALAALGNATNTVSGITAVKVFDAATSGNELFSLPAATSFGFTAGEEATFPAGRLVLDLIVAAQDADLQPIVINKYGNWVAGAPQSGFNNTVVALFNNATEVTGNELGARQSLTLNTTTGANTTELDFGAASANVTFNAARIFSGSDLLATDGALTPTPVSVTSGSRAKIAAGGLTVQINP
jgi:hypothetical protein